MFVVTDFEAKMARDGFLERFQLFVVELANCAAGLADQVVVVAAGRVVFVSRLPIAESSRFRDSGVDEEFERSVYRGVANAGLTLLGQHEEFFNRDV